MITQTPWQYARESLCAEICMHSSQGGLSSETTSFAIIAKDFDNATAESRFDITVARCDGWRFIRISSVVHAQDLLECARWYNTKSSSLVEWRLLDGTDLNVIGVRLWPSPA